MAENESIIIITLFIIYIAPLKTHRMVRDKYKTFKIKLLFHIIYIAHLKTSRMVRDKYKTFKIKLL